MNESANWYHFAITTDSETVNIYLNGERLEVNLIKHPGQYKSDISCNLLYFMVSQCKAGPIQVFVAP